MTDQQSAADGQRSAAREALVAGLKNAHALERQAVAVMEAQLGRAADYPDLHRRLTDHIAESREQARRLEGALESCGASSSMIKDALMSVLGLSQSSVQSRAGDAVIKAVLADTMFEHLEIASYRSLLTLADMAEAPEVRSRLEPSLAEEEAMASWLEDNLDPITRRYVELSAAGGGAGGEAETAEGMPETPWYAREQTFEDRSPQTAGPVGASPDATPGPAQPGGAATERP